MKKETLTKEQLLMKSEGVRDCIKWIEQKLKEEKKELEKDKDMKSIYGMFEDCGESYRVQVYEDEARMNALIETKVSLEKYMKN